MDPQTKPAQIRALPLSSIRPSPYQARRTFTDEALKALALSMTHEGLIQPITVRQVVSHESRAARKDSALETGETGPTFELISGERRLRAAKLLGWEAIEARVIDVVSEGEAAAKGLVENLQREDLDPIEEAEGFARLNRVDPVFWTQDKIAEVVGKNRTYVSRSLSLLSLPEVIQADMRRGLLTRNHGIELCRLPTAERQVEMATLVRGKISVQETRRRINVLINPAGAAPSSPRSNAEDPLDALWQSFLQNPWIGEPGATQIKYLGKNRWSFEVSLPAVSPLRVPLSADARIEIARAIGDRLLRLGRSLRVAPHHP